MSIFNKDSSGSDATSTSSSSSSSSSSSAANKVRSFLKFTNNVLGLVKQVVILTKETQPPPPARGFFNRTVAAAKSPLGNVIIVVGVTAAVYGAILYWEKRQARKEMQMIGYGEDHECCRHRIVIEER